MENIDVWKLASEIHFENKERTKKEFDEFLMNIHGKTFSQEEMIEKVIAPMIDIVNANNVAFTVDVIQKVVNQLNKTTDQ